MSRLKTWTLKRTKQCAKCPWKKKTNPHEIPNGYTVENHRNLANTIATDPIGLQLTRDEINVMSCHESNNEDQEYCVGWLMNQLGPGNNIAMRLKMMSCANSKDLELFGEQHACFADTLPDTIDTYDIE